MDLHGKAALLTGGTRIGRVVAQELAKRGCRVAFTYYQSKSKAEETMREIQTLGVQGLALSLPADVTKKGDLMVTLAEVEKAFGRLDILINMASLFRSTPWAELSGDPALWKENMDTDLGGTYWLSLLAAPLMKKNGGGRIVNVSDWTAAGGRPRYKDHLPYYVAKAGVKALTEALALELAPDILVNAVAPGPILPPAGHTADADEEVKKNTPLGRWGGAAEIAKAALFFIDSDFVTGECLRVDGGRHLY